MVDEEELDLESPELGDDFVLSDFELSDLESPLLSLPPESALLPFLYDSLR